MPPGHLRDTAAEAAKPESKSDNVSMPDTARGSRFNQDAVDEAAEFAAVGQARTRKTAFRPRPRPLTALLSRQDSSAGSSDDEATFLAVTCADCGDLFPTRNELLKHRQRVHTDRRPHQCPVCMASFWQADLLRQHARTHTDDTPHACTHCGVRFTLRTHVTAHGRALHSERSGCSSGPVQEHRCSVCTDRVFLTSWKLAQHMKCHSEERPFICTICQYTFKYSSNLSRHIKKHHPIPV